MDSTAPKPPANPNAAGSPGVPAAAGVMPVAPTSLPASPAAVAATPAAPPPAAAAAATAAAPVPNLVPFEPVVSKHFGKPNSHTLRYYQSHGGYETARNVVGTPQPGIIQTVKDSGLRGRGGAGFPTGMKWGFLAKGTGKPSYLAVNGDESEPGTFKDRYILEFDPHQLIEGVIISAYALDCHHAFIYLRGEFILGYQRLRDALNEAKAAGFVGKNIFGKGY